LAQRSANDSIYSLLKELKSHKNFESDTNYLNLQNTIAFGYWSSKPDSLIMLGGSNANLCHRSGYYKGEADALKNIGIAYWVKGDYKQALEFYNQALTIAGKIKYKKGMGRLFLNIALIYSDQGKYADALSYNYKSLRICESIYDSKGLALNYNNIAIIYYNQNKLEEAVVYYLKSLKISEQLGNDQDIAMAMSNIAELYIKQRKYKQALNYYEKSLVLKEKAHDMVGYSTNLGGIGEIYKLQGKFNIALDYYLRALKIQQTIGNKPDMAALLQSIGNCYFELKQFEKALDYCQRGLSQAKSIGHKRYIRDGSESLSKIFRALKNYDLALSYYQDFKIYSDSINNQETARQTAMLQAQYQFERREIELKSAQEKKNIEHEEESARQRAWLYLSAMALVSLALLTIILLRNNRVKQKVNHLLHLKNTEINSQKEKLEAMDNFKNRILSVVSHDVRGPLNSIKGMFYLVEQKAITIEQSTGMMTQINERISQVSGFVDDLLEWAKGQMVQPEIKTTKVQVNEIVLETLNILKPAAEIKGITLTYNSDYSAEVLSDEEMIKIVLRNLISNAIKFCKKGDSIQIDVYHDDAKKIRVSVKDSGRGVEPEKLKELFSSPHLSSIGTDNEMGTGLGLILCKQYIELNNGEIGVDSELGHGSVFWFSLPRA